MTGKKEWGGYSIESLYRGIRSCEVNIATFEDAKKKELQTITEYRWMIDKLKQKEAEYIKANAMKEIIDADIAKQNAEFLADAKAKGYKEVIKEEKEDGNSS